MSSLEGIRKMVTMIHLLPVFSIHIILFIQGFGSKKDFTDYLKVYMGKVIKYLEENGKKEEVPTFKKNVNGVFKGLLGKFKDLQFFTGRKIF